MRRRPCRNPFESRAHCAYAHRARRALALRARPKLQFGRMTMALRQLLSGLTAALVSAFFFATTPALAADTKEGSFTTSDGVRLHYIEAGSGDVLLMIPGWSQTAAQFKHQLSGLSDRYRVIALDMRGHGESDKPNHGYRIHRLSADVHEFILANNLKNVTLAGHSMGCSVIWGYWELFGRDKVGKLILIDQMPMITSN